MRKFIFFTVSLSVFCFFVSNLTAASNRLDMYTRKDSIPPQLMSQLISEGKSALPEVISALEIIDWRVWYGNIARAGDEMGFSLYEVLRSIAERHSDARAELIESLYTSNYNTRLPIVLALSAAHAPGNEKRVRDLSIIPVLEPVMNDSETEIRELALNVLCYLEAKEAIPLLTRVVRTEKVTRLKLYAAQALAKLNVKEGFDTVIFYLKDADPFIRRTAAIQLADIKTKQSKETLENALRIEKDPTVIAALVRAIREHTGETDHQVRKRFFGRPY
ncbi:MAG: HEAT repeat domain-containing protein [Elusimicrobiota bacterium]